MGKFYRSRAGELLAEKLEELSLQAPAERTDLSEEIDIMRVMALKAIKLYEDTNLDPNTVADAALQNQAARYLRQALDAVANITARQAKIRAVSEATFDYEQLQYVLVQVEKILDNRLAQINPPVREAIMADFKGIKLPERTKRSGEVDEKAAQIREALSDIDNLENTEKL